MDLELMGSRIISCIWLRSLEDLKAMMAGFSLEQRRQIVTEEVAQTTALILACCIQDVEMVRYLLEECGAPVNQVVYFVDEELRREQFRAPVLEAVAKPTQFNRLVLRTLLDHGADVNLGQVDRQFGQFFRLPLHEVCRQGQLSLAQMLLDAGADLHGQDSCCRTCLSHAAETSTSVVVVQMLVERGADINAVDDEGNSPLHYAVMAAEVTDVLHYLLSQNPDLDLVSLIGTTPFSTAVLRGHLSAANSILDHVRDGKKKVEMCELLGTLYADSGRHPKCASVWREAMMERWMDPANPIRKERPEKSVAEIFHIEEPQTQEELEVMLQSTRTMNHLSLLVKERVLGPCPMMGLQVHRMMCQELGLGNVQTALALLAHNLDLMTTVAQAQTVRAVWFNDFLATMKTQTSILRQEHAVSFLKLLQVCLVGAVAQVSLDQATSPHRTAPAEVHNCCKDCFEVKDFMKLFCLTMILALDLEDTATAESKREFQNVVQGVVEMDPRPFKKTLLHLCARLEFDIRVVQALVVASRQATATRTLGRNDHESGGLHSKPLHLAADAEGYTPLHLFARSLPEDVLLRRGLLQEFLDGGAHLCCRCQEGSILEILHSRNMQVPSISHQSLRCLAAIVLRKNPVFLQGAENVPKKILAFLEEH